MHLQQTQIHKGAMVLLKIEILEEENPASKQQL
jgi:hypothetical protein